MGASTEIAWTDATWNPIRGCTRVSAGCENCYAESVAARFSGPGQPYEGLATKVNGHARWTNTVRLVPEHLNDPLKWQRPRRVFVNSMSDLFHADVPEQYIHDIFTVMRNAPQHQFQVLTKRPQRMSDYAFHLSWATDPEGRKRGYFAYHGPPGSRPLTNVWLGTSVENQPAANDRMVHLLNAPAAVRFLSCEPLLGPIRMAQWLSLGIHWVIVGGESGPNHRPMDLHWLESIVQQCRDVGVAVFVKQDSGRLPGKQGRIPDELFIREFPQTAAL